MHIDLICKGCKYWQYAVPDGVVFDAYNGRNPIFRWCEIFNTDSIKEREFLCNGKYKKDIL